MIINKNHAIFYLQSFFSTDVAYVRLYFILIQTTISLL